jgi:hypothetical protein
LSNDCQLDQSAQNQELVKPSDIEGIPIILCHRVDDIAKARLLAKQLVRYGINVRNDEISQTDASEVLRIAAFAKSLVGARVSVLYVTRGAVSKWQKKAAEIVDAHQEEDPSFERLQFVCEQPFRSYDGKVLQEPDWTGAGTESEVAILAAMIKSKLGIRAAPTEATKGFGPARAGVFDSGSSDAPAASSSQSGAPQLGVPPTTVEPELSGHAQVKASNTEDGAAASMLDVSDGDEPRTGSIRDKYQIRRYDTTKRGLRQWWAPLPRKPNPPLLTWDEIRTRKKRIQETAQNNSDVASDLLQEATVLFNYRDDRIKAAETKATTLMGAVAIAASLVVAGAGLILDTSKVANVWRQVLIVTVLALLFCLLMCGYLSSRGLLTVRTIRRPQARGALRRAEEGNAINARVEQALDLLNRGNDNRYVADFKVVQNEAAHRWYRLALILFLALGALFAAYVLFGKTPT